MNNDQAIDVSNMAGRQYYTILPSVCVSRRSEEFISVIYYQEIELNLCLLETSSFRYLTFDI